MGGETKRRCFVLSCSQRWLLGAGGRSNVDGRLRERCQRLVYRNIDTSRLTKCWVCCVSGMMFFVGELSLICASFIATK